MSIDLTYFNNFNKTLSDNLKYIAYLYCCTLVNTQDFTTGFSSYFNGQEIQTFINSLLSNVYVTYDLTSEFYDGSGKKICIPKSNFVIGDFFMYMDQSYRIVYKLQPSGITKIDISCIPLNEYICDTIYYVYDISNNQPSTLPFHLWTYLCPSLMLDVCKLSIDPFYNNLVGYQSNTDDKLKRFKASELNFDASFFYSSAVIVCSLRYINTSYKGKCIQCYTTNPNQTFDIGFDQDTGMISYDDLNTASPLAINTIYYVKRIYNQMDTDNQTYFEAKSNTPYATLKFYTVNNILVPFIQWDEKSVFTYIGGSYDTSNVNDPVITVFTSVGSKYSTPTNICKQPDTPTTYKPLLEFQNGYIGIVCDGSIQLNSTSSLRTSPITNFTNNFTTFTSIFDSSASDDNKLKIFTSDNEKYKQIKQNTGVSVSSTGYIPGDIFDWYCPLNQISSELIILISDGVNIQMDIINKISHDNFNVWNNSTLYSGTDLRCNSTVENACKIENYNQICACYPSYIDKNLNNFINDLNGINKDQWCISSLCSSNISYKNMLSKNNSTCSQICKSDVNIKTSPYSSINIDNSKVISNCTNKSMIFNNDSSYCNCKDSESCSIDKTGKRVCVPKSTCNISCLDGYTCVIGKDSSQKCITTDQSVKICNNDVTCSVGEKCDLNYNVCVPVVHNNVLIPILIFFGTLLVCIGLFILYRKVINKQNIGLFSKENIKFYIVIGIVSILSLVIYFVSIKKKESFEIQSLQQQNKICLKKSDCSQQNSDCINNICSCIVGYNSPSCTTTNIDICNTLSFLPSSSKAGVYKYITVLYNTIYAFSNDAVFKFLNGKWYESQKFYSDFGNQSGYHPYNILPQKDIFTNSRFCTYNNTVIVFIQFLTDTSVTNSLLYKFDPTSVKFDINQENNIYQQQQRSFWSPLSVNLPFSILKPIDTNNLITVIYGDYLYIFGGVDITGTINNNIYIVNLLDNTLTTIEMTQTSYTYTYFSSAFVSTNNNIYLVGLIQKGGDTPYIYKFDPNSSDIKPTQNKAVFTFDSFTRLTACPNINTNTTVLTDYCINKDNTESILFFYPQNPGDDNPIYLVDINLNTSIPPILPIDISTYDFYSDNLTAYNLLDSIFTNSASKDLSNQAISYFKMNGFMFILTQKGNIYKITNIYDTSVQRFLTISPCLGVSFSGPPIYNKISVITPEGFAWSNTLNGFYQLRPTLAAIFYTNCSVGFGECNTQGGVDNVTYCRAVITTDPSSDPVINPCGINYIDSSQLPDKDKYNCSVNKKSGCAIYCKTDVTDTNVINNIQTNGRNIYYCSNNTTDDPSITLMNPKWIKSNTAINPNNESKFFAQLESTACNYPFPLGQTEYCTIPSN